MNTVREVMVYEVCLMGDLSAADRSMMLLQAFEAIRCGIDKRRMPGHQICG